MMHPECCNPVGFLRCLEDTYRYGELVDRPSYAAFDRHFGGEARRDWLVRVVFQ